MNTNRSLIALLIGFLFCSSTSVWAQSSDRVSLLKDIDSLRLQLKSKEDAFLEPSIEDRNSYAELFRQKDTSLIRLLPREEYDQKNRLTIRGGGAFYSFVSLTHEYGYGSDISLDSRGLSVGFAGADYGMLANLGDTPLDGLALETPSVQVLALYTPPTTLSNARIEQRRTNDGMLIDKVLYKGVIPAVVNSTYILRSVNYEVSDALVAFRVLKRDTDGSLILAWRMLKKYDIPKLERHDVE